MSDAGFRKSTGRQIPPLMFREARKFFFPTSENAQRIMRILKETGLTTICQEGKCPNIGLCWSKLHATFMLLGNICTRHCKFCAVRSGKPEPLTETDWNALELLARSIAQMNLRYVVLTMVTRDDLEDGGASYVAEAIRKIKDFSPSTAVEVLISDLGGNYDALRKVVEAGPMTLAHNLETVKRLTPYVRDRRASYQRSLWLLKSAGKLSSKLILKSGLMVGLGETIDELKEALRDLRDAGVQAVTIGQYLQPTKSSYPIKRYYSPEEFRELEEYAKSLGFAFVRSGFRVRSSYDASDILEVFPNRH